jgi:cytochrome c biogenesis protein
MFGFVGTQNVHVGHGTGTLYDWRTRRDEPLGFEIRVEEFRETFYPVRARVGMLRAGTSEKLGRLEVVEGGVSAGPGGDPVIRLAGYDSAAGVISFSVASGGVNQSVVFRTQAQETAKVRVGAYDLVLVSYRADLKDARARVSLVEAGAVAASGWLSSNTSVSHRGLTLFLTAWGADAEGNRFCGIQGARDPGAPFFWVGSVLLALAIPGHFYAKGRQGA